MKPTLPLLSTITLFAALGHPALAQTASPAATAVPPPSAEQAHALEEQIHAWLSQFVTGTDKDKVPPRPVQFVPAGDHYRVTVPLALGDLVTPADAAVTLDARMLDATRWQLDNQHITSPLTITLKQQVKDAPDEKNPSKTGYHEETFVTTLALGEQTGTQTFDPTFATPTTGHNRIASLDVSQSSAGMPMTMHFGPITTDSSITPVNPSHIDVQITEAGTGGTVKGKTPDGSPFEIEMDQIHAVSAISGFSYQSYIPLVHALVASAEAAQAAKDKPSDAALIAASETAAHNLLAASKGLLNGARFDETVQGVKFNLGGQKGTLDKYELGFDGEAPQDTVTAGLSLTLDGLSLPDLPPQFGDFVPTHIAIRPTVSNVSVADLTRLATDASAPGGSPAAQADIASLFQHGGLNFGFDTLELAIAGAKFAGNGKFVMSGPEDVSGQAELTATGLDALIAKAQTNPTLAQGVPMVIFLKGIAHVNGDQAVWQISVAGRKVLVNGVDLSAITGGMTQHP